MEYNNEIDYALHDMNNSLAVLRGRHEMLKKELGKHYEVLQFHTNNIITSVESIKLSSDPKKYKSTVDIPINGFLTRLSIIMDSMLVAYPQMWTTMPTSNSDLKIAYNQNVYDQVINNILSNATKAKAEKISLKIIINEQKKTLQITVKNDGKKYVSDKSSLFHGTGLKIIQDNIKLLNGELFQDLSQDVFITKLLIKLK